MSVTGPRKKELQSFTMIRQRDETGTSGTGVVLRGVVFPSGTCVVEWESATPCVQVWPSFAAFQVVHIDAHPTNGTIVEWH